MRRNVLLFVGVGLIALGLVDTTESASFEWNLFLPAIISKAQDQTAENISGYWKIFYMVGIEYEWKLKDIMGISKTGNLLSVHWPCNFERDYAQKKGVISEDSFDIEWAVVDPIVGTRFLINLTGEINGDTMSGTSSISSYGPPPTVIEIRNFKGEKISKMRSCEEFIQ